MTKTVYTLLLYLLLPFTPIKLLWRARKQKSYLQHWGERYGFYTSQPTQSVIWLHCVSVGETQAAAPLIQHLLQQYPQHKILLSHTTPTGRDTSEKLFGNQVSRVYLPYDTPAAVTRFLNHFNPIVGILLETELWFNLISECKRHNIPLLLVNARLSEKSALGYKKLGALTRTGLQNLTAIAAQTQQDAERLKNLGATHVSVLGNLKFDVLPSDHATAQGRVLRSYLGEKRPVFLAASTREGEEALIINAIRTVDIPNLVTLIVPRHPQRFDAVETLIKSRGLVYQRRSTLTGPIAPNVTVILGDTMGEMSTYYATCDVAFIGGSLVPLGGQNLIEATSLGKPVLIGPHTFNFEQASQQAITAGAACRVQNTLDLAQNINALFKDQNKQQAMKHAALHFSEENRGATLRTLNFIAAHGLLESVANA